MTQDEFERLHKSCFGCGRTFDVFDVLMPCPYQSGELAKLGVEHVLCYLCAGLFGNSPVVARVILTCVKLAIAEEHSRCLRVVDDLDHPLQDDTEGFREAAKKALTDERFRVLKDMRRAHEHLAGLWNALGRPQLRRSDD